MAPVPGQHAFRNAWCPASCDLVPFSAGEKCFAGEFAWAAFSIPIPLEGVSREMVGGRLFFALRSNSCCRL
jgi:hypothetical protein